MRERYPTHWTDLQTAAYRLVHETERGGKRGAEALAPYVGKAPASLSNEVNPDYQGAKLGLDDAVALELAAGDFRILDAHAAACGHVAIPLPPADPAASDAEVLELYAEWMAAKGETSARIAQALNEEGPLGRDIAQGEAAEIARAGYRHIARFLEFLERVKGLAR